MNARAFLAAALLFATLAGCLAPMDAQRRIKFLGDPADAAAAIRSVSIGPDTSYVNVTGGDIIRFVVGDKTFAWNFNGAGEYHFDLVLVAPPGVLDHKVMVYVRPDPFTNGGK